MNEENVFKLQQQTGCDPILGKILLRFTGNDLDGAVRIVESVDKDIYVFRGKFISQSSKYYGSFVFFYESKKKLIDKIIIAISKREKSAIEFSFKSKWKDFTFDLINYINTNKLETKLHEKFIYQIKSHKAIALFEKALVNKKEYDEKTFRLFFDDILFNITGDPNIAVKFLIDRTDAFEMNKGNIKEIDFNFVDEPLSREKKDEPLDLNPDILLLNIELELSPVDGLEISELVPGQQISVRIVDTRPIAEYISGLLSAKDAITNENLMVYAKVNEVLPTEHGFSVKVEFGPGILGVAFFGENVKVKVKEDKTVDEFEEKEPVDHFIFRNFWLIGFFLIIIVTILLLLIIRP